jgi:outer membrane protein OmpA-like peptidoglycan-associated protein
MLKARLRILTIISVLVLVGAGGGCSLVTVQQSPFPALEIQAKRPAGPPPRVVLTPSSIQISDKVQFAFDSAEILPASFDLLKEVAAMLDKNKQIEKLQVEGHTDSTGTPQHNRELSQRRAESVRGFLIKQGIAAKRVVAKGFGPDKPLADNATDEGKEKNRRVEFNIVKQGAIKTMVQDE